MSAKKRNFWFLLTAVGLLFSMYTCMHQYQKTKTVPYSSSCSFNRLNYNPPPSSPVYTPNIDEFIYVDRLPYPTNKVEIEKDIQSLFSNRHSCIVNPNEKAIIRILVDEKGQYEAHKVIKYANSFSTNTHDIFAKSLRFRPAIRDGKPIKYWLNVPLNLTTN